MRALSVVGAFVLGATLLGATLLLLGGCGGTICDEAADLCAGLPEAPEELQGERECLGDRECLSQCLVHESGCEPTDVSYCEDLCAGNVGGGSP